MTIGRRGDMNKKTKWYDEIEGTACVIILIFMLITLTIQVVSRYIFGISYSWIDELSRYSLIWFAYLSATYAIIFNAHIKIDLLVKIWPLKLRNKIKLFSNVIFFIYCIVVAYHSADWIIGLHRAKTVSMGTGIQMSYFAVIIPITHVLMAIRLIQLEIRLIKDPNLLRDVDEAAEALKEAGIEGADNQ
jgi:TRAP-type C4-dicarboxylate transport system permease small subunit